MFRYFKKTRWLHYGLGAGGFFIALLTMIYIMIHTNTLPDAQTFFFIIYPVTLIVWMYGIALIAEIMARKEMRKIGSILNDECDPERYIKRIEVLQRTDNKEIFKTHMKLNKAAGLNDAGRIEEANNILKSIDYFPNHAFGRVNRAYYLYLSAAVNMGLERYDTADADLQQLKEWLGKTKVSKTNEIAENIKYMTVCLEVNKGNDENAEEKFLSFFAAAKHELQRVSAQYNLGKIHMHSGRMDEARKAFNYVIEHGNKLHLVSQAKENLAKIVQGFVQDQGMS